MRTGTHFYSASDAEFINVYGTLANVYHYDGVVYSVDITPPYPTKPLYRFFNFKNGVHFYTANEAERANVQANLSDRYRYEGVAYRVNTDSHGIPITGSTFPRETRTSTRPTWRRSTPVSRSTISTRAWATTSASSCWSAGAEALARVR